LHDVLRRLCEAVDEAHNAAPRFQRLREKIRQHRIERLGRNVGEKAGEREEKGIPRQPGK
jgi:hypothetical protein